MLLDTCLLQHLKVVMDMVYEYDEFLTDETADRLLAQYPEPLGPELVALGDLMAQLGHTDPPPWVVAEASLIEFERLNSAKGAQLRAWWREWADYFSGCHRDGWYPHVDAERLLIRTPPTVADDQLSLEIGPAPWPISAECFPKFGPFPDAGDRALIRAALRAGVPTILTTDLNSFWRHRRALYPLGIEVWRPTDLWKTLLREAA
jgi:hypothetical protein